jgi:hypothetical protein
MVKFQTLDGDQITIDVVSFKKAYDKAVNEKAKTFIYKEKELLTDYAKYVLEYIDLMNKK